MEEDLYDSYSDEDGDDDADGFFDENADDADFDV